MAGIQNYPCLSNPASVVYFISIYCIFLAIDDKICFMQIPKIHPLSI
jgi:hypothetical protein